MFVLPFVVNKDVYIDGQFLPRILMA